MRRPTHTPRRLHATHDEHVPSLAVLQKWTAVTTLGGTTNLFRNFRLSGLGESLDLRPSCGQPQAAFEHLLNAKVSSLCE